MNLSLQTAIWLLALQGVLGAFDTLYFHEYRAKLPSLGRSAKPELTLHAFRDFIYAIFFIFLPLVEFHGVWALGLGAFLTAEILITLWDFVVEDDVRRSIGGVFKGERVTHAIMGIVYGLFLAYLLPVLWAWLHLESAVDISSKTNGWLTWVLEMMGIGVLLSGVRDLGAANEFSLFMWPWSRKIEKK